MQVLDSLSRKKSIKPIQMLSIYILDTNSLALPGGQSLLDRDYYTEIRGLASLITGCLVGKIENEMKTRPRTI